MPPVGFEPTTPAGERPQTYALDCAATETGNIQDECEVLQLTVTPTYNRPSGRVRQPTISF